MPTMPHNKSSHLFAPENTEEHSPGMSDPKTEIGYFWTFIALFPFPRRKIDTDKIRKNTFQHNGTVSFEIFSTEGKGNLPYGVHARKILLWLITTLKKRLPPGIDTSKISELDRRIQLPASPTDMYRQVTGDYHTSADNLYRQMADFRIQLKSIINTMFSIRGVSHSFPGSEHESLVRIQIVEAFRYTWLNESYKGQAGKSLKDSNTGGYIQLSEFFVHATIFAQKVFPTNAVPLKSHGITAMHFDIFVFLSYRLGVCALTKNERNRFVSWEHIINNFYETPAPSIGAMRVRKNQFKKSVQTCLERLKKAGLMSDVNVDFDRDGMTVWGTPVIPLKQPYKPQIKVLS